MAKIFSQVYLVAVVTAVTLSASSESFKLPTEVKVTDNIDSWMDMKSYSNKNEDGQRDPINSIPVSPRRRLMKYPENVGHNDGGNEMTELPILFSFRSQDGQPEERLVSYETEKSKGLERFYKHSAQPESGTGERIVFPSEDLGHAHDSVASSTNVDDGQYAGMDSRSRDNNPYLESSTSREDSKKTQEQYVHSLESLAQIVRHLLFRSPVSEVFDSIPNTSSGGVNFEYEPTDNGPEGSTSLELEVKDQSLYNGPKLRSSGSGDCPEGYKKTRNGLCQKPSRRLLSISR